jgi:hypothetical protein
MFPLRDDNSLPSETTKLQKSHPTLETQTQRTEDINKRKSSVIWPRQDASNCATFSLLPPSSLLFLLDVVFEKGDSNINRRRYFSPDSFGIDPIYMLPRAFADIGHVTQTRRIYCRLPRARPSSIHARSIRIGWSRSFFRVHHQYLSGALLDTLVSQPLTGALFTDEFNLLASRNEIKFVY